MNHNIRSAVYSAESRMPKWIDTFARVGIASKGTVYVLIGVLAAMAAFGQGGDTDADQQSVFSWILEQSYGQILLGLVIIGLLCYFAWRMIMAFKDPDGNGTDTKGMIKRTGFFFSGLTYLFFAFMAARMLIPQLGSGSGGGGNGQETLIAKILQQPYGQILVGILAVIVILKGFYELYRAVKHKFEGQVNERSMNRQEHAIYSRAGRVGYVARSIVFVILGYFLVRAAVESDASETGGTGEALSFLSNSGGPYLLAAVALGLAAYGIFMFIMSKYRHIPNVRV